MIGFSPMSRRRSSTACSRLMGNEKSIHLNVCNSMQLKKLRRVSSTDLSLLWDDGHQGTVSLKRLRDACPCAGCKGESILGQHYGPSPIDFEAPGRYDLKAAQPVGNYAMRFAWGDGHEDGIYSWDILKGLCDYEEGDAGREGSSQKP
ncbi:MAG TPA: DUF971 domain-containing protein [Bacteroidota bacterium]|nr:DUF971 domain-containing protein [Bacteroidota bacterium]